jgi:hypothetical protein
MTEFQMVLQKFKGCKPLGTDQIPAEMIGARRIKLHFEVHAPVNSLSNMEELPHQSKE